MKNTFTIGEISRLLNIPKSTIRYWESVGLIKLPRDSTNNYRKYNQGSVYTISDLAHFRCLQMSLQEMKRQPQLSPEELATSLTSLDHNLDKKLEELYIAKEYLHKKLDCIKEYHRVLENQYQKEEPDYDRIYSFSVEDTQAWSIYIKDQYQSILLYDPSEKNIVTGLAVATTKDHEILWKKNSNAVFLSFILKVDYSSPSVDAYEPHLKYLEEKGYRVSKIFARYLFSACDTKYYDYYKAYAEIEG